MGKKGKKDEKAAADDVFEPLILEAKQAATAVLMLTSPEDDVLSKTCEAIYKFILKNDENKKLLLDLGSIERLLHLLESEEKVIRRNALMALAGMTTHPDVRKHLRQISEVIPKFIRLLNPDEFTTTIEFASFGLSNMSQEFASIAQILENNGLVPLIECLKVDDPDVQKNSVECLAHLLQDFEVNSTIKDVSGLDSLLDLLESEYAPIQELALKALIRATLDAGNRAVLREREALNKFVDIIGNPVFNDLHVYSLQVIANCADDVESLQQLKENGGLMRLVFFIVDQTPPVDEQKEIKAKGKGKGSAKKKKGDDDKGDAEKQPSHTLPEVKMHAARAIARCARNADNRRILHECEAEKMLVTLLSHEDDKVRVAAAHAIAIMSESFICQDAVMKFEGLEHLLKMTKLENKDLKEVGSLALANLTAGNNTICIEVGQHHGIEHLLSCLSYDNESIAVNGLTALINMSTDDSLRSKAIHLGIIPALQAPLVSKSNLVQQKAALAVAAYVVDSGACAEFRNSGCLPHLVSLLLSNSNDVRKSSFWAVAVLANDYETAAEIYRLKGLEILQKVNESQSKRNQFSEMALKRLLDNNLPVKYALIGELGILDRTPDMFYDAGLIHPTGQLLSLEEYVKMSVNTHRPVLLLNSVAPTPTEAPLAEVATEEPKVKGSERKGSTGGRKSKSSKEKNLVSSDASIGSDKETEVVEKKDEEFRVPDDPVLRSYIAEVDALVKEATTPADEIFNLAAFVAEKMGGSIEPGKLMSFNYELPISELKTQLKSNVISIGLIGRGIFYHRALLFKFLADRVGINCTLVRGSYNRAWNQIWIADPVDSSLPPIEYIVDLMCEPGRLFRHDSFEAMSYKKI